MNYSSNHAVRRRLTAFALTTGLSALLITPMLSARAADLPAFNGYSSGAAIHSDELQTGTTRVLNTEIAFSGASANSRGLGDVINSEFDTIVQPASPDRSSFGRGSGFEAGVLQTTPIAANQFILMAASQRSAPPTTTLDTQQLLVNQDPIVFSSTLRGQSKAKWDITACPALGDDLGFGLGSVEDLQLVDNGANAAAPELDAPVLSLDATGPARASVSSMSHVRLVPQTDSAGAVAGPNFGLMSETRQTFAPITLLKGTSSQVTVELLGEWVLTAASMGVGNHAFVHYGPNATSPDTPIARILTASSETRIVTLQDITGQQGFVFTMPGVGEIAIGEDPRAIGGDASTAPTEGGDGTTASAAVDVARVKLLDPTTTRIIDFRLGHMEAKAVVPAGGITCGIAATKTADPTSVGPGDKFTYNLTINNPYDCILTNVKTVDKITADAGINYAVLSADPTPDAKSDTEVTWNEIGPINPGDHKDLKIQIEIKDPTGSGLFHDTLDVTSKCGLASAVANVRVDVDLAAHVILNQPEVKAPQVLGKVLAATGETLPTQLLALALLMTAAVLGAVALRGKSGA